MQRNSQIVQLGEPHAQHVQSLRNWIGGNAPIARDEAEFLQLGDDLASFLSPGDDVASWLKLALSALSAYCPRVSEDLLAFTPQLAKKEKH